MSANNTDMECQCKNVRKIDENTKEKNPVFVLAKINRMLKETKLKND